MNYRRPKFLEVLLEIRQEMARVADYDVDLFAEMVRGGRFAEEPRDVGVSEVDEAAGAARRRKKPGTGPLIKKA